MKDLIPNLVITTFVDPRLAASLASEALQEAYPESTAAQTAASVLDFIGYSDEELEEKYGDSIDGSD